eukprot:TRINITY_DN5773_c0_g1_i1.p1 TRINITY_DN5773_c0_g1~~TRINITY_DN5773_c0_g1_i1.p1  ORF type:complete len:436 (-),score=76.20 TRINITY_DN5773_c0_g1_i1:16-1323(-)
MVKVKEGVIKVQDILIKKIAAETNVLIQRDGAVIISLSQGTPNLPIFDEAAKEMIKLIEARKLPYSDAPGIRQVRETCASFITQFYSIPHGITLSANNIIVTNGATQAIFDILSLSIGEKSDVVISPSPAYPLYRYQTEMLGGTFVAIQTSASENFVPSIADLRAMFDQYSDEQNTKIRSIALAFPNNPCGSMLSPKTAQQMADFLDEMLTKYRDPGFSLILDEVYIGTNATGSHISILQYASLQLLKSTFLVLSASKGLGAMPGARAGFCCAFDEELVPMLQKIQIASSGNASTISQVGLVGSLRHVMSEGSALSTMGSYYAERVSLAVKRLDEIGIKYDIPSGTIARIPEATFYVFADFSHFKIFSNDMEICHLFRDMYKTDVKKGVAVIPGCAFGIDSAKQMIRLSCALEIPDLLTAMDIIEVAIASRKLVK